MLDSNRPSQLSAAQEFERQRHQAEVRHVLNTCYPDSDAAIRYFNRCAEHRSLLEVERLKADTREAWRLKARAAAAAHQ